MILLTRVRKRSRIRLFENALQIIRIPTLAIRFAPYPTPEFSSSNLRYQICSVMFHFLKDFLPKKCLIVCSVRSNRLTGYTFDDDKILKSRGRGSFDLRTEVKRNILALKWYDNKPVHLISAFVGVEPIENI